MSYEFTTPNELEILRKAEQERGEAIAAFFRWLFVERKHDKEPEYASDGVAAE